MTEEPPPARLKVLRSPEARSDLRSIDRAEALEILHCLDRYSTLRAGDIKKLKIPFTGYRLRCGDYRVFLDATRGEIIAITAVRHRREAYR